MIFKPVNININVVNINLRLARYHSRHLFRNFLFEIFRLGTMFTKNSLNVSAISMSSEITFSVSGEISGPLK